MIKPQYVTQEAHTLATKFTPCFGEESGCQRKTDEDCKWSCVWRRSIALAIMAEKAEAKMPREPLAPSQPAR